MQLWYKTVSTMISSVQFNIFSAKQSQITREHWQRWMASLIIKQPGVKEGDPRLSSASIICWRPVISHRVQQIHHSLLRIDELIPFRKVDFELQAQVSFMMDKAGYDLNKNALYMMKRNNNQHVGCRSWKHCFMHDAIDNSAHSSYQPQGWVT